VLALFPSEAGGGYGVRGKGGSTYANGEGFANTLSETGQTVGYGDSGSAARFFYCAKASRDDRDEGCGALEEKRCGSMQATEESSMLTSAGNERTTQRRNTHSTVKPTDLMRYLCRLITPPNGIVLDPFTGSGSTGKAAMAEGFRFIGIEREAEYIEIARARISAEAEKPRQLSLF
jgi:site-specific DNA-methyltransferase (adenine-specific)